MAKVIDHIKFNGNVYTLSAPVSVDLVKKVIDSVLMGELGALAYKDSASGTYTPEGTISTPQLTITIDNTDTEVVQNITVESAEVVAGITPVEAESNGITAITPETTEVLKSVTTNTRSFVNGITTETAEVLSSATLGEYSVVTGVSSTTVPVVLDMEAETTEAVTGIETEMVDVNTFDFSYDESTETLTIGKGSTGQAVKSITPVTGSVVSGINKMDGNAVGSVTAEEDLIDVMTGASTTTAVTAIDTTTAKGVRSLNRETAEAVTGFTTESDIMISGVTPSTKTVTSEVYFDKTRVLTDVDVAGKVTDVTFTGKSSKVMVE